MFTSFSIKVSLVGLSLNPAPAHTAHDVLAQEHEHQEQGCADQGHGGHLDGIVHVARGIGEGIAQAVGNQPVGFVVGDQAGQM